MSMQWFDESVNQQRNVTQTYALPVTGTGSGGAVAENLTQIGGTAVNAAAAAAGGLPIADDHGTLLDFTIPALITANTVNFDGGSGFSLPSSGFSNPSYFDSPISKSTGFDVTPYSSVSIITEGTFTGLGAVVEGTGDPTGATGWITLTVYPFGSSYSSPLAALNSSTALAYTVVTSGLQRMRVRVTAVSSGTAVARISGARTSEFLTGNVGLARSTNPGAGSTGTRLVQTFALDGSAIVKPYSIPQGDWLYASGSIAIMANTTAAVTIKTATAGFKNYVTGIQISWDAITVATVVAIRDGAGGTIIWQFKAQAASTGIQQFTFPTPIPGSVATLMEIVTLTATTAGGFYVNVQGYSAP